MGPLGVHRLYDQKRSSLECLRSDVVEFGMAFPKPSLPTFACATQETLILPQLPRFTMRRSRGEARPRNWNPSQSITVAPGYAMVLHFGSRKSRGAWLVGSVANHFCRVALIVAPSS